VSELAPDNSAVVLSQLPSLPVNFCPSEEELVNTLEPLLKVLFAMR
jgi:hypothetical protein